MKRTRYQFGCLQLKERAKQPTVWVLRYRTTQPDGRRKLCSLQVGTLQHYPTESLAWQAAESLRLAVNTNQFKAPSVTFGTLVDRYTLEALPERFSTRVSYQSMLKTHIRPRWSGHSLAEMAENPFMVEQWLKSLSLAQKTKAHLKALLHRLFEYSMKWKLLPVQRNPIELVEVKGATRRRKRPRILTVEEFRKLLPLIPEPYRTMVIVAQCLGLRVSELLALKWEDVDFEARTIIARRSVVHGRVDSVKTEYSEDVLPLDPDFTTLLRDWNRQCPKSSENWLFPNPSTLKPYHASPIQQDYIRAAGRELGLGDIGWHTFRHSYRSWLDATGAPLGVQQKLMRHAQISTTMNVYGDALLESKREANSKVVEMLKPVLVAAR
ncbi:MAG TPA: site-specific integrase [Candidatus Angelobacter sp.]|nr:site-specific integrase [Candidatus Angelobacter sp.]